MTPTSAPSSVSFQDLTAILARRKRQILITFFLVLGGIVGGTLLMPKQYATRMKVLVKNERADMVVSPDNSAGSTNRGEVSEARINSEIELLTSNNLLQQVVTRCGLEQYQQKAGPDTAERHSVALEKAVKRLLRSLDVSAVRRADIIQVEYADSNPRRAVAVLATLAELYLEEHLKVHSMPGTYEFFKGQAERYQRELEDAESKLADYRRRENIDMLAQQKDVMLQKAAESESALLQAEAAIGEYSRKIADTRRQLGGAQPRVLTQRRTLSNQYSVERLHTMLAELQNRRTQLLVKYLPDDRLVQEADQEIRDTQAALEEATRLTGVEQATDINPVYQSLEIDLARQQSEFAGLQSRREALARQTDDYRRQSIRLADATAPFDDLVRTQKEAEDNYLLYTRKREESRIDESLDRQKIANVTIAETPVEPHVPSKPNVELNVALGILLAGFLSVGGGFIAEYLHDTIEQPRELEELTGLPVLAVPRGE